MARTVTRTETRTETRTGTRTWIRRGDKKRDKSRDEDRNNYRILQRKGRDKDRKITERKGTRIPDRTMDNERTLTGTVTK